MKARHVCLIVLVSFFSGALGSTIVAQSNKRVVAPPLYGKEITATQFLVVDQEGRTRAVMGMYGQSGPGIRLYDESGAPRIAIDLEYENPRIAIIEDGVYRAEMSISSFPPGPQVSLNDKKGVARAKLRLDLNDDPRLHLHSTTTDKILNIEPSEMK